MSKEDEIEVPAEWPSIVERYKSEAEIHANWLDTKAENAALKNLLERAQGILSSLILHDGVDEEEANKLWDEINAVIPSEEVKF